jgi:predicted small lipoprotein YifL
MKRILVLVLVVLLASLLAGCGNEGTAAPAATATPAPAANIAVSAQMPPQIVLAL